MKTTITLLITFFTLNTFSQITYYSDRDIFHNNCSNTLVLEDFEGGPTDSGNTGCDGDFSAAGNSCFPAGEIQPGIVITSSDNSSATPMVYTNVGFVSNPTPIVGTNQYENFTIMNFPDENVNAVGLDLYGAPFASSMNVRIYNIAGDLVDSITITDGMPGPYFFGFISNEIISSIEFEANGSSVELVGMVEFGETTVALLNDLSLYNVNYYPNPILNQINFNANYKIEEISIINTLGQEIKQINPLSKKININLSDLTMGTYFFKVKIANKTGVYKVIKK